MGQPFSKESRITLFFLLISVAVFVWVHNIHHDNGQKHAEITEKHIHQTDKRINDLEARVKQLEAGKQ